MTTQTIFSNYEHIHLRLTEMQQRNVNDTIELLFLFCINTGWCWCWCYIWFIIWNETKASRWISHYNLPNRQKVKSSHSIWVKQKCYVCKLIQYGFFCCSHITVGGVSKNEFFEFMKPRNFFWNDKLNTSCRCGTVQQTYSMLIACISIILLHILTRSKRLHSNACN